MNIVLEGYKKLKEEFLKKKIDEKFDYLYEKLADLEEEIENKECEHNCEASENSEEIEKIINRQNIFNEGLKDISKIEEKIDGIIEILKIEEKVEKYVEEKAAKRFWKRVGLLTSGKKFTAEEFYSE